MYFEIYDIHTKKWEIWFEIWFWTSLFTTKENIKVLERKSSNLVSCKWRYPTSSSLRNGNDDSTLEKWDEEISKRYNCCESEGFQHIGNSLGKRKKERVWDVL